ncbi:MAG: bifunctional riboflavin kinase/FAD synthetase [Candidatus Omnitrophica bacterium]|nr:bifunctional riboflavin kinase/FAD synthetase [Candidatus Omnitrophota bacterium]MCM8790865.1 bifunctional riboflavin kinase/FAD synthetase [Candidatus Omnitrophota bacterium]
MNIIKGLNALKRPRAGSVVTIGVFDGVHIGHVKVIGGVVKAAKKLKAKSIVFTFEPHPAKVLHTEVDIPSLMSLAHRIRLIGSLGVDILVIVNFTDAVSGMSAVEFMENVLVKKAGVKEVHVGDNFYFGRGALAGVAVLKEIARQFSFRVKIVKPAKVAGRMVSSSLIRSLILSGDIKNAARLLGRPVSILGTVVSGARLARELGYPTANINPHHEVIPPRGVYAVLVRFKGKLYEGVLNIGSRPTFYAPRDQEPTIEVHIFGFKGRIYGMDIEVFFIKKLREEMAFSSKEDLVRQIEKDSRAARKVLRSVSRKRIKSS